MRATDKHVHEVDELIVKNISTMDIIIDTKGQPDLILKERLLDSDDDDLVLENIGINAAKKKRKRGKRKPKIKIEKPEVSEVVEKKKKISSTDIDLEEFEQDMGWSRKSGKPRKEFVTIEKITKVIDPIESVLKKSVVIPGFEQSETVPRYDESRRKLKILRRKEREKTKGKNWFNLPATEMTPEIKRDLQIIQMRSVLDPKHFYKKNDMKALPKYFQIGKIVDSPVDYYNGRLTKKERKRTIVDELMADAEFSKFNKRKYKEIVDEKRQSHFKAHRHARKLKGKKK